MVPNSLSHYAWQRHRIPNALYPVSSIKFALSETSLDNGLRHFRLSENVIRPLECRSWPAATAMTARTGVGSLFSVLVCSPSRIIILILWSIEFLTSQAQEHNKYMAHGTTSSQLRQIRVSRGRATRMTVQSGWRRDCIRGRVQQLTTKWLTRKCVAYLLVIDFRKIAGHKTEICPIMDAHLFKGKQEVECRGGGSHFPNKY